MKKLYLVLAVTGFVVPNIFVVQESLSSGNILLWFDPHSTVQSMFSDSISSAFVTDLLLVVFVFILWSYYEAKKYLVKRVWMIWLLTFLFGMAGSFPLFLYFREVKREEIENKLRMV